MAILTRPYQMTPNWTDIAYKFARFPFTCAIQAARNGRIGWVNVFGPGILMGLSISLAASIINVEMQPIVSNISDIRILTFQAQIGPPRRTLIVTFTSPYPKRCIRHSVEILASTDTARDKPIAIPLAASINGEGLGITGRVGDYATFDVWASLPDGIPSGKYTFTHRSEYDCRTLHGLWSAQVLYVTKSQEIVIP